MTDPDLIMIVEDDPDISDALAAALEDRGYQVLVAANGRDALARLRAAPRQPRLILLDLMMPVMDGWEFRAAQRSDPSIADVPVILLSAHVDIREAAERLGASAWLRKPLDLRALLKLVEPVRGPDADDARGGE